MSNPVLGPAGIVGRYRTHRKQLMTLYVTRQGQDFVTSGDLQLCDVKLINASVELVGEPGIGNFGNSSGPTTPHNSTVNKLHAINDAGTTSTVYGIASENRVISKTHLTHRELNISITGMTQGHHFRQDQAHLDNNVELMIPTDYGIMEHRNPAWPAHPIQLENVHLQQNLKVHAVFAGNWPANKRIARFVEDWALTTGGTKKNADGTIRYFVNDDEGQSSSQECQVPANCINAIKLVFEVTPQSEL